MYEYEICDLSSELISDGAEHATMYRMFYCLRQYLFLLSITEPGLFSWLSSEQRSAQQGATGSSYKKNKLCYGRID